MSSVEVRVEPFEADHHEHDLRFHEVVVAGDGGDFSWSAYADRDVAEREAGRLREMLSIVLGPDPGGSA